MFLRYNPSNIVYEAVDPVGATYTAPSKINRLQMTCPCKTVNQSKAGPIAVMSYFEAVHCRKTSAGKIADSKVDSVIASAQALDLECADDNEFIPSDEGYVSFYNFMKAAASTGKFSTGSLMWANTIEGLKQMIHRRGNALIELYLISTLLTENACGVFDISSAGAKKVMKHDYTKVMLAVAYDQTGLVVMNSLGLKWGKIGFARIAWSVLMQNLEFEEYDQQERCFVKACSFKGCFN